ncbi:four-carbon acid sugar kinase family protein [Rhodospirillaceae bacterium KN72]|uniref:3-oxo-tetronate kinase n=1 Tax=Pacificispira spongiicola TaxID=2729598 RepID=A0A7Y0DZG0_9PROT|nr:3-oxo-tetronate kinase [Pacificispira spongiicola]NMM43681.1 four-carbon acid sugar kinase family protein [Pacificispira spongiicola]
MLLGCIGDDLTGSSDLANTLLKGGMTVTQYCGIPSGPAQADVEAGVVALKTRSIPVADAVRQSVDALEWLIAQGCRQFFFKYCSTFDSTPEGNIGPVAEALMDRLNAPYALVCPAFPGAGRTVYQGHLFVGDRLLNESGMENHPLTPMTDADIRRWLTRQSTLPVGHVPYSDIARGAVVAGQAIADAVETGARLIVLDAVDDIDLLTIGAAAVDTVLVTGGSGIALGLPANFRSAGDLAERGVAVDGVSGPGLVLAGSCSNATRKQVALYRESHPALEIDPDSVIAGTQTVSQAMAFLRANWDEAPLIFSSADPDAVRAAQKRHGVQKSAEAIEFFFAELAGAAVDAGIRRLVSAGGETSGAVIQGIGCEALRIGPEIDPGVPALRVEGRELAITLKSGNFGTEDFFEKALKMLAGEV